MKNKLIQVATVLTLCFIVLAHSVYSQEVSRRCDYLLSVLKKNQDSLTITRTKRDIPKLVIEKIEEESNINFRIMNPGRKFQKNDVRILNRVDRQLQFVGSKDGFYLVVYKKGGRGLHTVAVLSEVKNDSVKICNISAGYYSEYSELLNRLKAGNYIEGFVY